MFNAGALASSAGLVPGGASDSLPECIGSVDSADVAADQADTGQPRHLHYIYHQLLRYLFSNKC